MIRSPEYNIKLRQILSESQDNERCLLGADGGLYEPQGSRKVSRMGNLTFQIVFKSSSRAIGRWQERNEQ